MTHGDTRPKIQRSVKHRPITSTILVAVLICFSIVAVVALDSEGKSSSNLVTLLVAILPLTLGALLNAYKNETQGEQTAELHVKADNIADKVNGNLLARLNRIERVVTRLAQRLDEAETRDSGT